jgi:citrate lyase subunit beta/citryl-CoA lyase
MIRSALMVAGDKIKHLQKLPSLQCDIAMVNLEDGVYDKKAARELVSKALPNLENITSKVIVRVNALDECGKEDIMEMNSLPIDAIRVPKIKTLNDVELALDLIAQDKELHLSIETKEAFDNLSKLKIDSRVTTAYLGILDLLESLELSQDMVTLDNPTVEYILSKFLIDCKIAGLTPISFMFQDYKDIKTYKKWCEKEKKMGYGAKSCLSPAQVDMANSVFEIDAKKIEKAKYIVAQFKLQKAKGVVGFSDEKYGFIDEPIYKDALGVLKNQ